MNVNGIDISIYRIKPWLTNNDEEKQAGRLDKKLEMSKNAIRG